MNQQDLNKFRSRLMHLREKLTNNPSEEKQSLRESTSELSSYDNHPGDIGSEQFEKEKDAALSNVREQTLMEVDHALKKIDQGTFGKCESCDKDISKERLMALPYTRYCISCLPSSQEPSNDEHPYFEGHTHLEEMSIKENDSTFFDKEDTWQTLETYGHAGGTAEDYENTEENLGSVDKMDEYSIGDDDLSINPGLDPERFKRRKRRQRGKRR